MFPDRPACQAGPEAIEALVGLMRERSETVAQNHDIPAGFTYLGQFIDHDLTFDPTPLSDRRRDPHALINFRTPRLDLDSLYGLGPEVQPYLYDWDSEPRGARLLVGANPVDGTPDLPRNDQQRALIGDPRNDENLIVAQLHLVFIRFHNAVVDRLTDRQASPADRFEEARRIVRAHYQSIVGREFLPNVVGETMARDVVARRHDSIPVEFSGAAYRFGHSMVRDRYGLKRLPASGTGPPTTPFAQLAGHTALTRERVIDWERFFDLGAPRPPQASFAIDTALAPPLFALPEGEPMLARRNLLRGRKLGLPSGQEVASALGVPALEPEELRIDAGVGRRARDVLLRSTPLWYYVLCEAEQRERGKHLGPVGGRIVAEVLSGLLDEAGGTDAPPTMAGLIEFAHAA